MIQGIQLASLNDVLLFKKGYGREKDMRDVELIEQYLNHFESSQPSVS